MAMAIWEKKEIVAKAGDDVANLAERRFFAEALSYYPRHPVPEIVVVRVLLEHELPQLLRLAYALLTLRCWRM